MIKEIGAKILKLVSENRRMAAVASGCVFCLVLVSVLGLRMLTPPDMTEMLMANVPFSGTDEPDMENGIVIAPGPGIYIPSQRVPLSDGIESFDASDKSWWEGHVNSERNAKRDEIVYDRDVFIGKDGYELADANVKKSESVPQNKDVRIYVDSARDVLLKDLSLDVAVLTFSNGRTQGNVILQNSAFNPGAVQGSCFDGIAVDATYNYITSNCDGLTPNGGDTQGSYIAYNWIQGPGRKIGDNHGDGIQFWREGNAVIYRNRIGGYNTSCIMIKSDLPSRYGSGPIKNITIKENYFENKGLEYYYIYVCENAPGTTVDYLTRPQYITITDNWFEDSSKHPIYSGLTVDDRAVFVRTEEERDEGVLRQERDPSVLEYRASLGYARSAVDARTWIVWDNNRWVKDGSEAVPTDDGWRFGGMSGWYDLSEERVKFPGPEWVGGPSAESGSLNLRFDEDSGNGNYPTWYVDNISGEPISAFISISGGAEFNNVMKPGENKISFRKLPGDNMVKMHWAENGAEKVAESFGVNYTIQDLVVEHVASASDSYHVSWDIKNPNSFTMQGNWVVDGSELSGTSWIAANSTTRLRTNTQPGSNVLKLTWLDEYAKPKELIARSGGEVSQPSDGGGDTGTMITVRFDEDSGNGNYPTWYVNNATNEDISVSISISGGAEFGNIAKPGENKVSSRKVPGDNMLKIRWKENGSEKSAECFGVSYVIQDLAVKYVASASDAYNVSWDIENPNGFTMKGDWVILDSDQSGTSWAAANSTVRLRTKTQPGSNVLTLTWLDEYGKVRETTVSGPGDAPQSSADVSSSSQESSQEPSGEASGEPFQESSGESVQEASGEPSEASQEASGEPSQDSSEYSPAPLPGGAVPE